MQLPRHGQFKLWNLILFVVVAVGALVGVPLYSTLYTYTWFDWTLAGILYVASGLGITVGYHRLLSHRSFTCTPGVQRLLLICGAWALQNSASKWVADHLRHHRHCDTDLDPYNAQRGFWYSHCGWLFYHDTHTNSAYATKTVADPLVRWQHTYYGWLVFFGLAIPVLAGYLYGGLMAGIGCGLLAGVGRTFAVLNSTFCINSVCHLWGTQPHGTTDSSRNSWIISCLTFGEGYHNYHHMYPTDYRNGTQWYHIDPSKWVIQALAWGGYATTLRRRPHLL